MSDDDSASVDTVPIPTTVAALTQVVRPSVSFPQRGRVRPVELKTFLLRARLARVSIEDDSDLHLVLRDLEEDRLTIVAEIPHQGCTANPAFARRFEAARQELRKVSRDGIVEIIGVGFFDFPHGQSGMAQNGLEIHPVLSLRALRQ